MYRCISLDVKTIIAREFLAGLVAKYFAFNFDARISLSKRTRRLAADYSVIFNSNLIKTLFLLPPPTSLSLTLARPDFTVARIVPVRASTGRNFPHGIVTLY